MQDKNYTGKPEGKGPLLRAELYKGIPLKLILNKFCIRFRLDSSGSG
jgi:hypothetical protein